MACLDEVGVTFCAASLKDRFVGVQAPASCECVAEDVSERVATPGLGTGCTVPTPFVDLQNEVLSCVIAKAMLCLALLGDRVSRLW